MLPWEGKPEFSDAVCYITGILEQQRTKSNVHAYSFRSQCYCCYYWPWVLLTCLFLSLQGSRITWPTCFLSPLWEDPDGSAWWPLTCPEGCLLVCGTKQLYVVTPPFQPQIAIARTAQSTPEIGTLSSPSSLSAFQRLGQLHQQKIRKLRDVSTYCPHSSKHKPRTCEDATIIQTRSTAKDCSLFATLERCSNEVMLQKASFGTSRCEKWSLFLMGKAFKWRNL